jgi:hypothetical protein
MEDKIRQLLENIGQGLSAGDPRAVANCWEVPALVLSDQGSLAITDSNQIEGFFGQAIAVYRAQGLMATRPEIEHVQTLSESLASVDVRWPAFDAAGTETSAERSHYVIQVGKDGQARIRVALTRTV